MTREIYSIETFQPNSLWYVSQNMQIWKPCDKKLCHNDVISKNNRKVQTSEKPVKLYIIQKVLMIAINQM